MENKEIYIDGVDVSGCIHYKNKNCIADYCLTDMPFGEAKCEKNPNCHYKNWQRKEQECEELLKFNNSLVEEHKTIGNDLYKEIKDYRTKLKAKEQECEELNKTSCKFKNYCTCDTEKLKQTLTEIKEIIRNQGHIDILEEQILQKISEVEDGNF